MELQTLRLHHAWEGVNMQQNQKRIAFISIVLVLIAQTLAWAGPSTLGGIR
jgi:hypothetical protein